MFVAACASDANIFPVLGGRILVHGRIVSATLSGLGEVHTGSVRYVTLIL